MIQKVPGSKNLLCLPPSAAARAKCLSCNFIRPEQFRQLQQHVNDIANQMKTQTNAAFTRIITNPKTEKYLMLIIV